MKRTMSDEKPTICRIGGGLAFPHDIIESSVEEDGVERMVYSYLLLRIPDRGQPLLDYDQFKTANYRELRQKLYPPMDEQMDMLYHGTWEAEMSAIKSSVPKPPA